MVGYFSVLGEFVWAESGDHQHQQPPVAPQKRIFSVAGPGWFVFVCSSEKGVEHGKCRPQTHTFGGCTWLGVFLSAPGAHTRLHMGWFWVVLGARKVYIRTPAHQKQAFQLP